MHVFQLRGSARADSDSCTPMKLQFAHKPLRQAQARSWAVAIAWQHAAVSCGSCASLRPQAHAHSTTGRFPKSQQK